MTRAPDLTDRPDLAELEPLQSALQMVLAHLQHMDMAVVDATLALRLKTLAQACTALQTQLHTHIAPTDTNDTLIDASVFDRLMQMAGPDTMQDLLDRLVEDLQSVQVMLITAQQIPDWDVLRMQSHILMGLAGAVGAEGLQLLAQHMNALANDQRHAGLDTLMARVVPALTALITFVQTQRSQMKVAQ